ncbi:hypothetical protein BaRGS_00039284 [Batillaria attramentaria]|uniref:Uncharacterized protein n=1 Tax=Batillaria attramentaria TaxID=370345 RepID=A0ABD0J3M9_9CAEN
MTQHFLIAVSANRRAWQTKTHQAEHGKLIVDFVFVVVSRVSFDVPQNLCILRNNTHPQTGLNSAFYVVFTEPLWTTHVTGCNRSYETCLLVMDDYSIQFLLGTCLTSSFFVSASSGDETRSLPTSPISKKASPVTLITSSDVGNLQWLSGYDA